VSSANIVVEESDTLSGKSFKDNTNNRGPKLSLAARLSLLLHSYIFVLLVLWVYGWPADGRWNACFRLTWLETAPYHFIKPILKDHFIKALPITE
jgi:hypothetical protein